MATTPSAPPLRTCGIIMPISHVDDDHTVDHWTRVLKVIETAIGGAGLHPQPVWENGDFDIIQARILKNIFENEIVVCDVSTRNPNVMLEFGMRLTTKKPTVVIAEVGTKLPFDTAIIHTEFYDPSLEYTGTAAFIERLSKQVRDTDAAASAGTFHTFLESFHFETVVPKTVPISAEKLIEDRLDTILTRMARMESKLQTIPSAVIPEYAANLSSLPGLRDLNSESEAQKKASTIFDGIRAKPNPAMIEGVRVHHQKFGEGTIADVVDGVKLEVEFDKVGRKRVMNTFVQLI